MIKSDMRSAPETSHYQNVFLIDQKREIMFLYRPRAFFVTATPTSASFNQLGGRLAAEASKRKRRRRALELPTGKADFGRRRRGQA